MRTPEIWLVAAMLAQVALTFAVGFWLGRTRARAVREGAVTGDVMLSNAGWPKQAKAASNNFSNLFEVPVLFYALALLALHLRLVGWAMAVAAVVFVASRVAHSIAHCTTNRLRFRAPAYFVGIFAVIAMWGALVVALIAA